MIVDLVLSVKERSSSRSGSASPVGILLFSVSSKSRKPIILLFLASRDKAVYSNDA